MKKFTEAYLKLEKDPSLNHILMIIIFFACEKRSIHHVTMSDMLFMNTLTYLLGRQWFHRCRATYKCNLA